MNKILLCFCICITGLVNAQNLIVKGKIHRGKSIEIAGFYDGNFWKKHSELLKADYRGRFNKRMPQSMPTWFWIGDDNDRRLILLSPDRSLTMYFSEQTIELAGRAAPENRLIANLSLHTTSNLPFIKELEAKPAYVEAGIDSILQFKFPEIMSSYDSSFGTIARVGLPEEIKKMIAAELKYQYANALTNELTYWLNRGAKRRDFHLKYIDTIIARFPVPSKEELESSPAANIYLERFFRFRFWKEIFLYTDEKNKVLADERFERIAKISFSQLRAEVMKDNEMLVFTQRLGALLPTHAREKLLNNKLFEFCMTGRLQDAARMCQFIQRHSTDARLIAEAEKMYAPLKKARDAYAANLNIRIRSDYRSIASLNSLLAPYIGKTVFIDMWGTWCPHCIDDMAYEPELKKQFANREIVFLYVAQDTDKDDEKWRDFIFTNNITGEHVRKTAEEIGVLWNALGVPEKDWAYPRYFIVDKKGKIIVKDAKRPKDGELLYQQLKQAMNE